MASPGQKKGLCGHIMALFDAHSKCACCREKGIGQDPCIEKKPCQICDNLSEDQKKQLATPTYRARKELQKKSSPSQAVNPADVTVLGKVESRGETSDRGKTPSKKAKKSSHKSPTKKKAGKTSVDFQADLKSMDDKWSECFARLEAIFLAKSFQVPVEPVKKSDMVVTDRPFIPPVQQATGVTGEKQSTGAVTDVERATQPVQVPGAVLATRPVEAPGAAPVTYTTGQEADLPAVVYRPEVQPPGPAVQPSTTAKQSATSRPGSVVPVEELAAESDQFSDPASSLADEGEVSDLESTGPDREEPLDVDQELTAEQTYRETLRHIFGLE